ncbi:MAG: hydroxymethylbilane synthase [bacterium]|nr:hydroxymethylbilane synthase [bacterium]
MEYFSLLNLINIEINHKVAPIELREKLFFNKKDLLSFRDFIFQNDYLKKIVKGVFVLSTCNRTSLFFDLNNEYLLNLESFGDYLIDIDVNEIISNLGLNYLKDFLLIRKGLDAVENLLRIACGLESQVFGETDIIKQIKQYYKYCKENSLLTPFLEILINKVLHYSKEFDKDIRAKFSNLRNNFASTILNFIKNSNYQDLNLLFIGLGSINKQIVCLLLNNNDVLSKIKKIIIVSNYYDNFRQNLKGNANLDFEFYSKNELKLALSKLKDILDIIIVNSKNFFLEYTLLEGINKEIIIFDFGLPRSVDPYISNNFKLINLDKLKEITNFNINDSNLDNAIEFFIKSKIKEFYDYIISRVLDKKLINFYKEMDDIKNEILFNNLYGKDLLEKYIKKLIYRISKKHKEFLTLTHNTHIFRKQIILGSRGSKLALIQTERVLSLLRIFFPDFDFFVKIIKTSGDKKNYTANSFVKELEESLINEEIDIAVHSLKDVPYVINDSTFIGVVLKREEPNDILISKDNKSFWELPKNSVIGTSSLRRKEQLKMLRPDLFFKDITGNVDTRIKKLKELNQYDAIVLAKAAIKKMNLESLISYEFSLDELVPAVGQGVIALQTRINSFFNKDLFKINDIKTFIEITIEREIMGYLKLGCRYPLGLYVSIESNLLNIYYFFMLNNNIFKGKKLINLSDDSKLSLILNILENRDYYFDYKDDIIKIIKEFAEKFIKEILVFV